MGKLFTAWELAALASRLLMIFTLVALYGMDGFAGADWPEWGSMMTTFSLTVLPVAWLLVSAGQSAAPVGRWIALAGVLAAILRVLWVVYDSGPVPTIAVVPLLVALFLVAAYLVYTWPRRASRALRELAWRNGWQVVPTKKLQLPILPLPVGVARSTRDAVRTPTGVAFEVRWVKWHWLVARRVRLSAFIRLVEFNLPTLEVRPGGLARSDLTLESERFNRAFDVLGDDPRYLMAVLHPRNMDALLGARPIGLTIDGRVIALYDRSPLAESLIRGLAALDRLSIPRHVLEDWGKYAGPNLPNPGLKFRDPGDDETPGGMLLRLLGFSGGLLGFTWLGCYLGVTIYGS
ncbi:hypothetical protein HPO96_27215 [Kribbella sandramycini]|uniref:Uncharacterized protein n=1 Tax=Kribbella sandramycini TaxID=60450 RepID=A0A7Y4L3Z0_9ACTN|nr:hypothetical protein [Kribbella sandramycini]MBB6570813.1 hypothetical protein [Kribbella sandramycini]NOL43944.1 hypothetical protein [Kribbella sandramycini]